METITPLLDHSSEDSLYSQLYNYIKKELELGKIGPNTKLPSIRGMSKHLGISITTVKAAYDQLQTEGYIEAHSRSGYYTVGIVEGLRTETTAEKVNTQPAAQSLPASYLDFHIAKIDTPSFPISQWQKLNNFYLKNHTASALTYGHPQGEESLRTEIAKYLKYSRAVKCVPQQIIIWSGTQQSINLLSQILDDYPKSVAFEEPGYDDVRTTFMHNGYTVYPVPLEHDGLNIRLLRELDTKLVYCTPNHQFPCGMVMPISKRMQLLNWAASNDAYIIEDDYDGEFRYHSKPIPSLQGQDNNDRVIYIGTFSKTFNPAIRANYMVLPNKLTSIYKAKFQNYDSPVSKIHQETLNLFFKHGYWEQHIRKMRKLYEKKHDVLLKSLNQYMGKHIKLAGCSAGLHVMLEILNGENATGLAAQAELEGIKVYTLRQMWTAYEEAKNPYLFIGFASLTFDQIEQGIKKLSEIWFV